MRVKCSIVKSSENHITLRNTLPNLRKEEDSWRIRLIEENV